MLTDGSLAGLSVNFESIRDYLMAGNDHDLVLATSIRTSMRGKS